MKNTVILFCCHFWSPKVEKEFFRLKESCDKDFDVVLSYDYSKNPAPLPDNYSSYLFTPDDIKKKGYNFNSDRGIWYHIEYPVVDYYLRNPQYDFYWRIEYDVKFGDDWGLFFRNFIDSNADLLGTYIKTYKDDPAWFWWEAVNFKISKDDLRGMFFPVVRFSRAALDILDRKYKNGMSGYCEIVVPTLLNMENLKIEDIGKHYYNLLTFNFNFSIIRKKGKLHHPVREIKLKNLVKAIFSLLKFWRNYP